MKKEWKICLPVYKLAYSVLFVVILSLVRGIVYAEEIGIAMDSSIALLAIVFCADTYAMEFRGGRWEVLVLVETKKKVRMVRTRLAVQMIFLCLLAYAGYICFYWQGPRELSAGAVKLYGIYLLAVTITILFWGVLSMMIVNLVGNLWAGMGITLSLWLLLISASADRVLGRYNIFAFIFRTIEDSSDMGWLWGKGIGVMLTAIMVSLIPFTLRKRGLR